MTGTEAIALIKGEVERQLIAEWKTPRRSREVDQSYDRGLRAGLMMALAEIEKVRNLNQTEITELQRKFEEAIK